MSFFDTLKQYGLWPQQQGGQGQGNPYGLDEGMMRQARMQSLSNLGAQIMAASVKQTPRQRADLMAGFDPTGGYQQNLYNAAQMKLLGDKQREAQEGDERDRAAKAWMQQKIASMPDSLQKRNAMIYLQLGDVQKAAEMLTAGPAEDEYQIVDGYRVKKNDPNAPAIPIPGFPQPGEEPANPGDVRAAAKDYYTSPEFTTFTSLATSLGSLSQNIDNPDRVADLDFVYAAANALDPGSVVREGDYLQIVRTQGLSGELIANINQVTGGQGLTRQTREKLFRLIKGRASQWREATARKRDAVLRYSAGVITPEMLDTPINLPDLPGAPAPITAPGRVDLPEPELLRVDP
jgi:hypothetical protein